ncbi:MAG: recombinase family protein [Terracidiphilus sp.]
MKKVIELIRVSTEQQAALDRASIPAQRTVNRRTCQLYGLEIVGSIELADVSGASVLLAPEIQELMRLMQSPDIDGVVAREFSRLMRPENFTDYALLQAFSDSKTILYLPEGPIDLNSKTGRLMGTIRAAIAGMERTEILERVMSAKEEKRRQGKLAQSSAVLPFGIGYDEGRGFYYEPKAELVREAFSQFLAGNQSYAQLAKMVGVTPRGMHTIMRNPIWMGWRVIDKKRDPSGAGKYARANGRQADRRKMLRAPEDVIRVRVIEKPMITQQEFETVQRIMDRKQQRHWRSRTDYDHRFTYNGFLTCSACGEVVHTALARRDYYACKGRRVDHACDSKYMGREKLEGMLDNLFAERLTSLPFLEACLDQMVERTDGMRTETEVVRLTAEIAGLRRKRERVIDSFIEDILDAPERDRRLRAVDERIRLAEDAVNRTSVSAPLDAGKLIEALAPLGEWESWTRDQKRQVLLTLVPDIRVADYKVESLGLNLALVSNENTRSGRDSWQPRA